MPCGTLAARPAQRTGRARVRARRRSRRFSIGTHWRRSGRSRAWPTSSDDRSDEEARPRDETVKFTLDTTARVELGPITDADGTISRRLEPIKAALEQGAGHASASASCSSSARETKDDQSGSSSSGPRRAGRGGGDDAGPAAGRRADARDPDAARGVRRARARRLSEARRPPPPPEADAAEPLPAPAARPSVGDASAHGSSVIVSSLGALSPPGRSTEVKVPARAGVGVGAAGDGSRDGARRGQPCRER